MVSLFVIPRFQVSVFNLGVCVHLCECMHICVQCQHEQEEGIRSLRAGVAKLVVTCMK